MRKKRKTLPKEFREMLKETGVNDLRAVFDKCDLNATGGYSKGNAFSFYEIPDDLVYWLVEQGADIDFVDMYGRTPLHQHSGIRGGRVEIFIELGADINKPDRYGDTPIHMAAGSGFNVAAVKALLRAGANPMAVNNAGEVPLVRALLRANNIDLENLATVAEVLLASGTPITEQMRKEVLRIGENFEFHRENFNKDFLPMTEAALNRIYELFGVEPVARRRMHDGISPIIPAGADWKDQYNELWDLLIPSSGPAKTVQGEVIRITGRVRDEIYRNGGANWDGYFNKMVDDLLMHLTSQSSLAKDRLEEVKKIVGEIQQNGNGSDEELLYLCESAVLWVLANPSPIPLDPPEYNR